MKAKDRHSWTFSQYIQSYLWDTPSETDLQYQLLTAAADDDTNRTSSFTLFCPKDSQLFNLDMAFNANVYVSTLRYHVIFHCRLIFLELQNLSGSFLDTLLPHYSVLIGKIQNDSVALNNGTTGVMVDGVRVTYLDIFVGSRIVVHEINDVLVTGLNKYSEVESDKNGLGVTTTLEDVIFALLAQLVWNIPVDIFLVSGGARKVSVWTKWTKLPFQILATRVVEVS
ncbi:uncharacterized protein Fot_34953 [Forsythia ovata]|uniref:FAS1 domain-containing protein n=1 Tax=Forsythia ovata TaxID=205694 RepID=A0ABD1SKG4_9LAMI